MWMIGTLDLSVAPQTTAAMSDGLAVVGQPRGGYGASQRLMIDPGGSLDVVDCGEQSGGPFPFALEIGGQTYWYATQALLKVTLEADGQITVTGDGNDLTLFLMPFPVLNEGDLSLFFDMVSLNLVPYPTVPEDGRPFEAVAQTAADYFAWSPDAMSLGLAVYDWTTADFFRMDVFNYYRYTAVEGAPLDGDDIIQAIWTTSWPPYVASDPAFMGSMMMQPATSQADVAEQYANVAADLKIFLDALKAVTAAALTAMPRVSTLSFPVLYSGQVDVSNLGQNALATYFLEYPGNAGPPPAPMGEPLDQALAGFMSPGAMVTLKSFMSTTSSQAVAAQYANGILLEVSQAGGALWNGCAYVTPLSDEATKDEYLFAPGTQFVMGQASQQTIGGKLLTVLPMTALG